MRDAVRNIQNYFYFTDLYIILKVGHLISDFFKSITGAKLFLPDPVVINSLIILNIFIPKNELNISF